MSRAHFKDKNVIYFGPRTCIRLTIVDPLIYKTFAVFGACVLADRVISVSEARIARKKDTWESAVEYWIESLKNDRLRGVVDVLCIKTTRAQDAWKAFMDEDEEYKRSTELRKLFERVALAKGVDLRVFPYGPNEIMIDNVQSYVEEIKQIGF